jgi:hypothetical protein
LYFVFLINHAATNVDLSKQLPPAPLNSQKERKKKEREKERDDRRDSFRVADLTQCKGKGE